MRACVCVYNYIYIVISALTDYYIQKVCLGFCGFQSNVQHFSIYILLNLNVFVF